MAHDELTAILVAASPLGPVLIPDHEKPSQEEEIPPDHVELAFKSPPAARPGILDKLPFFLCWVVLFFSNKRNPFTVAVDL